MFTHQKPAFNPIFQRFRAFRRILSPKNCAKIATFALISKCFYSYIYYTAAPVGAFNATSHMPENALCGFSKPPKTGIKHLRMAATEIRILE